MRILHTSDWHIGRRIENIPLEQEFDHFISWLIQVIDDEQVDLLIVAGDIFDTGMPSIQAQRQYYTAISRLAATRLQKIIIINGNHDSANFLLAPRIVLSSLKTFISAGLPSDLDQIILPFPEQEPQVVIAAVPYLRDIDIINYFNDRPEDMDTQQNIAAFYHEVGQKVMKYKDMGLPVIVTGHLFVSDSAHDQQDKNDYTLGGLIDISSSQLPDTFDYYALGHVHRPWIQKNKNIVYCGNPFFMGLNDIKANVPKGVNIIDTEDITQIKRINTPVWRQMVQFEGSYENVCEQLSLFRNSGTLSPAYAYVKLTDYPDNTPVDQLYENLKKINQDNVIIIKAIFPPKYGHNNANITEVSSLKEYTPRQILEFHLDQKGYEQDQKKQILETFDELLAIYRQNSAQD